MKGSCYWSACFGSRRFNEAVPFCQHIENWHLNQAQGPAVDGHSWSHVIRMSNNNMIVLLANISVHFMRHIKTLQQAGSFPWQVKVSGGILVFWTSHAGGSFVQVLWERQWPASLPTSCSMYSAERQGLTKGGTMLICFRHLIFKILSLGVANLKYRSVFLWFFGDSDLSCARILNKFSREWMNETRCLQLKDLRKTHTSQGAARSLEKSRYLCL